MAKIPQDSTDRYAQWMANYAARYEHLPLKLRGKCKEAVEEMHSAFPELKIVRGHVTDYTQSGEPQGHWWLVYEAPVEHDERIFKAPDGAEEFLFERIIVDPTQSQYGAPMYYEWDESQQEPTGKCPNCGDYCFNGDYCCTKECHDSYVAYCNSCTLG